MNYENEEPMPQIEGVHAVCNYPTCTEPVRRGQALCRKHWMALDHWNRTQIGNAMKDEGKGEDGWYHGEEYVEAVRDAVQYLKRKERVSARPKAD